MKTQNYPGKILGYMSASLPILGSINPGNDLGEMLEENVAGLCSVNGDDQTLYENALKMANDSLYRRRVGANARQLLERYFSVTVCANQILSHFQNTPVLAHRNAAAARLAVPAALKNDLR